MYFRHRHNVYIRLHADVPWGELSCLEEGLIFLGIFEPSVWPLKNKELKYKAQQ